jgi:3-oxoacyl-[acyl-carrier-protein] synthase II
MGIISPVGNQLETAWQNVCEGRSGIRKLEDFDVSTFATQIAGTISDFDVTQYLEKRDARRMDIFMHYGIASSVEALKDSGLEITGENGHRVGVAMGAGIGGLATIEDNHNRYLAGGSRKISPFFIPGSIINMVSGNVSIMEHITGPNLSVVTACATSTHSIGIAARSVMHGDADVMLAGGSEYATTPLAVGGFCSARAMSSVVLEELEHARARGARIYAEMLGFGMSGDAYHITSPPEDGEGARKCMVAAMKDAKMEPADIDYLNAHGTSTPVGDKGETFAIKRAFGDSAERLAVSSTKSCTGHLLGAAGVVEAIFSILAIRDQVLPPTINLENPDPECDLDYVPHTARDAKVATVISNSFGFGGTNASLIFRAFD